MGYEIEIETSSTSISENEKTELELERQLEYDRSYFSKLTFEDFETAELQLECECFESRSKLL